MHPYDRFSRFLGRRGGAGDAGPSASLPDPPGGSEGRFEEQSIGATLTMPLYQSGAVYSRLREVKKTVGQERLEVVAAFELKAAG